MTIGRLADRPHPVITRTANINRVRPKRDSICFCIERPFFLKASCGRVVWTNTPSPQSEEQPLSSARIQNEEIAPSQIFALYTARPDLTILGWPQPARIYFCL